MKNISSILAVVNNKDDGEVVINKARTIAKFSGARLQVLKVVYEGFVDLSIHEVSKSHELKTFLMQAEESFLEDLLDLLAPVINSSFILIGHRNIIILQQRIVLRGQHRRRIQRMGRNHTVDFREHGCSLRDLTEEHDSLQE